VRFYTYLHRRNDTGEVFYIGKGRGDRATSKSRRNKHWNHIVDKHGRTAEIVAPWPTEAEALDHEKFLIACFRGMGIPLVNLTDGGDGLCGHVPSQETRAKRSASHMGKRVPDAVRKKMSEAKRAQWADPVARKNMVSAMQSCRENSEYRAKISANNRARFSDPEVRKRHSAALCAKLAEPEIRAKLVGRKHSPETRAKIASASRARAAALKLFKPGV
jgi:hypothetical protein